MRVSKHPEERRAELIAAARDLFDKYGVERTRVSDIVQKVGVAQGVFYYYFKSKNEMIDAVMQQLSLEIKGNLQEILRDKDADFAQRVAQFIELYIDVVDQFLGDDALDLRELEEGELKDKMVVTHGFAILTEGLHQLVEQGVHSGDINIDYPQETAEVALYGLRTYAAKCLPSRPMLYTIVEQTLGLAPQSLVKHIPKEQKKKQTT